MKEKIWHINGKRYIKAENTNMELEFYGKNRRNERINTKKRRNHRSDKPNKWRPIEIDRLNGKETTNQMDCEWSIYDGKMRYS